LGKIHSTSRFGFYDGCVGVAYAAVKLAFKLDNSSLLDTATNILRNQSRGTRTQHFMDMSNATAPDYDNDSSTNVEEVQNGTDPCTASATP